VTTPVRAPLLPVNPARWARSVWMARTMTARQRLSAWGLLAKSRRNGQGKLSTHWRTGTSGKTWLTRCADVSIMRRAPQEGQKPRRLQEKARGRPGQVLVPAAVTLHTYEPVFDHAALVIEYGVIESQAPLESHRASITIESRPGGSRLVWRTEVQPVVVEKFIRRAMAESIRQLRQMTAR